MSTWTHITSDFSALFAAEQGDVFMVQLVACCFGAVPLRFVQFLNTQIIVAKVNQRQIKLHHR